MAFLPLLHLCVGKTFFKWEAEDGRGSFPRFFCFCSWRGNCNIHLVFQNQFLPIQKEISFPPIITYAGEGSW